MRINYDALRNNGFGYEIDEKGLTIYPETSDRNLLDDVVEILTSRAGLGLRQAELLTDSFLAQIHMQQVWNAVKKDNE